MKIRRGMSCLLGRHSIPKTVLQSCREANLRSCSSDSPLFDHISFIKDVAATRPPANLSCLLKMLQLRGLLTALLRHPTSPHGLEMPVVEVRKHGIWILAKDVDHYIHRILIEEDVIGSNSNSDLFEVSAEAGENRYKKGDFAKSQISNIDDYLLRKVGMFPDVLERKVMQYYEKGDRISALVTGDFYTKKEHFPGIGRPFVFNAEVLLKFGRTVEAKDAARGALKSPWWTLGCRYQDVVSIANWYDEPIESTEKKLSKEHMQEDLSNGKSPEQIAIDEAALLLDLASVDGAWDHYTDRIVECYKKAGLNAIARFVNYRD